MPPAEALEPWPGDDEKAEMEHAERERERAEAEEEKRRKSARRGRKPDPA